MTDFARAGEGTARAAPAIRLPNHTPATAKNPSRKASRREIGNNRRLVIMSKCLLMPVEKLGAVHECPNQIDNGRLTPGGAGLRMRRHQLPFLVRGITRKNGEI